MSFCCRKGLDTRQGVEMDEQKAGLGGMDDPLYMEKNQERRKVATACPSFTAQGVMYRTPSGSGSTTHRQHRLYEMGVVENILPRFGGLTCMPFGTFLMLEDIHVSCLYG